MKIKSNIVGQHWPAQEDISITGEPASASPSPLAGQQAPTLAPKRIPALTPKQASYVSAVVDKGMSKVDAYIQAYDHTGTRKTAHEEASRTARVPQVKLQLDKYSSLAESTMITVMEDSARYAKTGTKEGAAYASVAVSAAKDVLDRVHGKATQRVETTSKAVILNIDLTGVTTGDTGAGKDNQ